jgi:hypothetical protein
VNTSSTSDETLLERIKTAVRAANAAEKTVTTAQAELVSRSKAVGVLLLEAKKLHPKVKDFEAFLNRVDGLKLSRAYDCMRIAGGRTTDEELREEARERKRKSRAKKKLPPHPPSLPKPEPTGKPDNFRDIPHVTETPAHLDERRSARRLRDFIAACEHFLPEITIEKDREEARRAFNECAAACWTKRAA